MNLETLKHHIEKVAPRQPVYFFQPDSCPFNTSWQGKVFLGHLYFKNHANIFQVFECPMCGKRDAVEVSWKDIDIDDPRFKRGGLLSNDGVERVLGLDVNG